MSNVRKFGVKGGEAGSCGYTQYDGNTKQYISKYTCGGGGGGYGGGGGGSASDIHSYSGGGGGGGYLKTATIKLTSLDPIAVTVGKGGRGGYDNNHLNGEDGEASSFGSYVVAEGGGGGKCLSNINVNIETGGRGGTNGGNATSTDSGGGGGGGGYLIGCNVRGNGGDGYCFANADGKIASLDYSIMDGIGLGGAGGAGGAGGNILSCGKPGQLGGGIYNKIAGPGSGVVVVTW